MTAAAGIPDFGNDGMNVHGKYTKGTEINETEAVDLSGAGDPCGAAVLRRGTGREKRKAER